MTARQQIDPAVLAAILDDRAAAGLMPASVGGDGPASKDERADLYDSFAEDSECVGDMAPGAAIAAFVALWLREHGPALAIGALAGVIGLAIPAILVAVAVLP